MISKLYLAAFGLIILAASFAAAQSENGGKKNERPEKKAASSAASRPEAGAPVFFYRFVRPGFVYSPIEIEHDEKGMGRIRFVHDGSDEVVEDPIKLSPKMIAGLTAGFDTLDLLSTNDQYQYERDYSHLGNATVTIKKGGRERSVTYNWTEHKTARFLMDEYRRISNEYIWKFEITIARENQPLRTPLLMQTIDRYITRGEISDPPHLVPILNELSTDERMPLMARNHALRLITQLQKTDKK
jgi:hypothetical protein